MYYVYCGEFYWLQGKKVISALEEPTCGGTAGRIFKMCKRIIFKCFRNIH
jgi:hypothetical protein